MSATQIQSEAFDRAALRSERIRIIGLLSVVSAMVLVIVLRGALLGEMQSFLPGAIVLGSMAAYEWLMLRVVSRAMRSERTLSQRVWVLNVFIETLFPTIALFILTEIPLMGPYRALVAPTILVYFVFIVLSTLRLRPILSVLTGVFSTVGYLSAIVYTFVRHPSPEPAEVAFPLAVYLTHAAVILIGGVVAGGVAGQIREHVAAALREVELRRHVEQLEHDLNIARSIQQGLLPDKPLQLAGFEIAGWNQPADQTGGDYFDWQELPDGRFAISLADVTGHGIGPALVMAVCRAYARASFPADADTTAVMDRINRLLVEDLPAERFVTFVVAILDPGTATMELVSAGHGPILHYRSDSAEFLDYSAQGIPLGLMAGIGYGPPEKVALDPGDMLVLTTDGFFEWENPGGEEFGLDRLMDTIRNAKDLPPGQVIEKLHSAVTAFAEGTKQADDLTAVILKRTSQ